MTKLLLTGFRRQGWSDRATLTGLGVLGVLLTAAISLQVWWAEQAKVDRDLAQRGAELAINLREGIHNDFQLLDDFVIAEQSVDRFDRGRFASYVAQTLAVHPEVQALSWLPRVSDSERASFEQQARQERFPDFRITEQDATGQFVPAARRDVYFPVYYNSNEGGPWSGFDIASSPVRSRALQRAASTNEAAATATITLLRKDDAQPAGAARGFLAMEAVRDPDSGGLRGLVQVVFSTDDLIGHTLSVQNTAGLHLEVADVTVEDGATDGTVLYDSPTPAAGPVVQETSFDVGGRTWRLSASPTEAGLRVVQSSTALLVFVGGLLITALVLGLAQQRLRRARERAQADEAVRRSEAYFRALIENTAEVFVVTDPQGVVRYVSPSVERVFGYPTDVLVQQPLGALVLADYRVQAEAAVEHGRDGGLATYEWRVRHADGSARDVEVSVHHLLASPAVGGIVVTARDITERKQAEQERRLLAQGEKLRALGQMASGVAHDLNQSLQLIGGYADLSRRALDDSPPDLAGLREMLPVISQAAQDGGQTVRRLLAFGRQQLSEQQEFLDLGALLRETAQLTAPRWRDAAQAEGRPISLHVEASGDVVVRGSGAELREVLANLVFNAVDALPRGGTIRLSAARSGEDVHVEVADSGTGMSPEVQERVFEPFFTTKGNRGTGLGLAQAFGIVQHHGGTMWVQSAPGAGTTMHLRFPAAPASPPSVETDAPPAAAAAPVAAPVGLRVLAVDDEVAIGSMVKRVLRRLGHTVVTAASGEEALEQLGAQPFDVVISDVGMGPGINGWELAEHIRQRWPDLPVVLATGWGAQIDPAEARTRGVSAVLAKPYRPRDLESTLAELLVARTAPARAA